MKKLYVLLAIMLLMIIAGCASDADKPIFSSEKAITAFSLDGVTGTIDQTGKTIVVNVLICTDLTALTPTITHTGRSISPAVPQNFSSPVAYTVTAANGTSVIYTVTVTLPAGCLPKTGQTASYATGDDGNLQKGVAWPGLRFTDHSDQTITDNLTGLMWTQNGNAPGPAGCTNGVAKTWQGALDHVACLNANNYLGYDDWRLPNRKEIKSLVHYGQTNTATWLNDFSQGFNNVADNLADSWYWTSTTCAAYDPAFTSAWIVNMSSGQVFNILKATTYFYVWPVRTGQSGVVALPKTGQTASYATGDDGDLEIGAAWPATRFTDNSDETITDNVSGLIWTQDGNAPGPAGCSPGVAKNTQDALDYIACLNTNNYLGYDDWRLPNVNELESLVHYGQANPSVWLNTQGFTAAQSAWYRSSTTNASDTSYAWVVMMGNGNVFRDGPKTGADRVWPVRDGN